jgi:hypothetical protein
MKNYKVKALLQTSGGQLLVDGKYDSTDDSIKVVCTDSTGSWTKEFFDRGAVWTYLHTVLDVKNVIKMMEVL